MPHRRSHPADHVHFATGLAGTLRWMHYWATSRLSNTRRTAAEHWNSALHPALRDQADALKKRVQEAMPSESPVPHGSLADAVRQRGLAE